MGFPAGYTQILLPKLILHTLSLLTLLRFFTSFLSTLFSFLGLPHFLQYNPSWPEPEPHEPEFDSFNTLLIRQVLPAVKFSNLGDVPLPESCTVCLSEFEEEEEVRRLINCNHVFHKECIDRWVGYDRKTCPLCRSPVIPDEAMKDMDDYIWAAADIPDFYGDFSAIS